MIPSVPPSEGGAGPGPWGIYPIHGKFYVTREREFGKKDQEVHGDYPTLEIASEVSGFLTSEAALRSELAETKKRLEEAVGLLSDSKPFVKGGGYEVGGFKADEHRVGNLIRDFLAALQAPNEGRGGA